MSGPEPAAETELKFSLALADVAAFPALPFLAGVPGTRTAYWTTYFDTDDYRLRQAGYSLRLRRSAGVVIQTLKGPSTGVRSGFFSRAEHEKQVDGDALDLAAIAEILPEALQTAIAGRLQSRFDYQVERNAWVVPMPGGTVTVSIDHGIVEAGDRTAVVAEAEFETLSGNLADLVALARQAIAAIALHVEPMTKAERGYFLASGRSDEPDTTLDEIAGGTLDTLRRAAGQSVRAAALARRAVIEDGGPERVHELRVALRRLRALIDLVEALQPAPHLASSGRTARRAFRRLGAVRDIDLVLAALPATGEDLDLARRRLEEARALALMHARRTISGRRFAAGIFELLAFGSGIETGEAEAHSETWLRSRLIRLLDRRWKTIRRSDAPGRLAETARHGLRKLLKRFRYTSELANAVIDPAKNSKVVAIDRNLRQLQDHLGAVNDRATVGAVGRHHLGQSLARTLGLAGSRNADAADLDAADNAMRSLADRKPYWRR